MLAEDSEGDLNVCCGVMSSLTALSHQLCVKSHGSDVFTVLEVILKSLGQTKLVEVSIINTLLGDGLSDDQSGQ